MFFKTVTSCPQDIDTIVLYMQYDEVPDFTNVTLQDSFDLALGGDSLNLSAGSVKSFRIRHAGKFVNLLLAAFDFTNEDTLDAFRKVTLKLGTKLNEVKAEKILVDGLMRFKNVEEILYQFSSACAVSVFFTA